MITAIKYDMVSPYCLPGLVKNSVINLKPVFVKDTIEKILDAVSETTGVSIKNIKSKKRYTDIVTARQIYCLLCRRYSHVSLKEIGKLIGNRDHTTVIHSVSAITGYMETDQDLRDLVRRIEAEII